MTRLDFSKTELIRRYREKQARERKRLADSEARSKLVIESGETKRAKFNDGNTSYVENLFKSTPGADVRPLRRFVPGLSRPFGVGFGPNGQMVIPRSDGTVEIRLVPSACVPNEALVAQLEIHKQHSNSNADEVSQARISGYKTDSMRRGPRHQQIWSLVDAAVGEGSRQLQQVEPRPRSCMTSYIGEIQQSRVEGIDHWIRSCSDEQTIGFLSGEDQHNQLFGSSSIEDIRLATISAQGPGVGEDEYELLRQAQPRASAKLLDLVGRLTGTNISRLVRDNKKFNQNWISTLALHFWNRKGVLDPLETVLDDVERTLGRSPTDGAYRLLRFFARPSLERFTYALMGLRDNVNDWSTIWHLGNLLIDGGLDQGISLRKYCLMTMNFSFQLERAGLWPWAVYVVMKARLNSDLKKKAVLEILLRHPLLRPTSADQRDTVAFLHQIGVPPDHILYAKAVREGYSGRFELQVETFKKASDQLNWAHAFASTRGISLLLRARFAEFSQEMEEIAWDWNTVSRRHWHMQSTLRWLSILTGYADVNLGYMETRAHPNQATFANFHDALVDYLRDLVSFRESYMPLESGNFPRMVHARTLLAQICDWVANRIVELVRGGLMDNDQLKTVQRLPLSMERRTVFERHHPSI